MAILWVSVTKLALVLQQTGFALKLLLPLGLQSADFGLVSFHSNVSQFPILCDIENPNIGIFLDSTTIHEIIIKIQIAFLEMKTKTFEI